MKKLLVITNHSYMLWQFRRQLLTKLQEQYSVTIATPFVGHEEDFANLGFNMVEISMERRGVNPFKDRKLLRDYDRLIKQEKPDMVVTYSIKPNVYAGLICRMRGIPYCANVQGLGTAFQNKVLAKLVTLMYSVALKKAKTVFFENVGNAEEFCRRRIMKSEQQTLLPGAGVDLKYHSPVEYSKDDTVHFLYLGRIMREKGIDELLQAYTKLREKYGDKVMLDIVGFYEDDYKQRIETLVDEGLVVFHGFSNDPRPYYAASHCVVLPSYHEGMSNVLLEAAATARPLITSDIPGCREAVDPGKNGYLCPSHDADSLYQAMEAFMKLSPTERSDMGLAGRNKMQREFDRDNVVETAISAICK